LIRLVDRAEPYIYLRESVVPTQSQRYGEHPAAALSSVVPHLKRVGASLSGIVANDAHTYGYHLSAARLRGTGKAQDYSMTGPANAPAADQHAACAIDIGMAWPASRTWLEWVRAERAAGRLPQITELIGSTDGRAARYAAASTGWKWSRYTGDGHVAWCHVAIGRRYANQDDFGDALLGRWTATGLTEEEDDMGPETMFSMPKLDGSGMEMVPFKTALARILGKQLELTWAIDGVKKRLDDIDKKQ
jgi:hypothetical protein